MADVRLSAELAASTARESAGESRAGPQAACPRSGRGRQAPARNKCTSPSELSPPSRKTPIMPTCLQLRLQQAPPLGATSARSAAATRAECPSPSAPPTAAATSDGGRRRRAPGCALLLLALLIQIIVSLASGQQQAPARQRSADQSHQQKGQFCQTPTVGQRAASAEKVFCFYDIQDDFRPQDLNPCLCTHVVYSYVAVRKNLSFIAGKKGDLRSLANLKRKNPRLKLLVSLRPDDYFSFESVGALAASAADHNDSAPLAQGSPQAANEMHQKFAKRVRDFIVRHSLDGLNLDWPYFAQTMASADASREHLTLALQAINENFQSSLSQSSPSAAYLRLLQAPLVTLTVSKDFHSLVEAYDFRALSKLVDFVHLPAFDFDLNVDQYSIGHPARLHGIFDAENLDTLVDLLLSSGLPSDQLIAGLPAHGVQITSTRPTGAQTNSSSAPAQTIDEQLEAAANISIVSHSEVCRVRDLARRNCSSAQAAQGEEAGACWTMSRAPDLTAPFAYDSEHWIGFDDETSVKLKAKYVLLRHLAGVAMFTVNHDDPTGSCGFGPFPLLSVVNSVFARAPAMAHSHQRAAQTDPLTGSNSSARGYFTRAPNQILTATSLVAQIFGSKAAASKSATTSAYPTAPSGGSGDLMQSASDDSAAHHRPDGAEASGPSSASPSLMSFADIIEKYALVGRGAGSQADEAAADQMAGDADQTLPCDKIGYQRYPRDCSRFYRCVQTPPLTNSQARANAPNTTDATGATASPAPAVTVSVTRLQYECPSGLVFDEQFQICNWPSWSAQCSGSGEVNSITNSKFVCPNYGYFQNQENCEYFYYCSDYNRGTTQAYQFRCPFELGFDEERLQCNWKWLVKGCNATDSSGNSTTTTAPPTSSNSSALAHKYLASLAGSETSAAQANGSQTEEVASTTTGASLSRRSFELDEDAPMSGRAFVPALASHMTSLLASIAALREHRIKKAAQTGSQSVANSGASPTASDHSGSAESRPKVQYPKFVGTPAGSAPSPPTGFRVRRRQQEEKSSTASGAGSTPSPGDSVAASSPYRRRPPPASIFPSLPSSAIYMLVDSLRSVGEAAGDEVNRVMRLAGDRMRELLGQRGGGSASGGAGALTSRRRLRASAQQQQQKRSDEGEERRLESSLTELAARLATPFSGQPRRLAVRNVGLINSANYHAHELALDTLPDDNGKRTKRTRRDAAPTLLQPLDDLQALESDPTAGSQRTVFLLPAASQQQTYRPPAGQYNDPLGRPAGYPLNPLDEAAKRAVLGPEPKVFSQPTHLVLDQLSGISQQDYERLLGNAQPRQPQLQLQSQALRREPLARAPPLMSYAAHSPANSDPMLSSGSEQQFVVDHSKVIERILEQAREALTLSPQQPRVPAPAVAESLARPFGMPAMSGQQTGSADKPSTPAAVQGQQPAQQQRRRPTVAMRLATLALPRFSLLPTTTTPTPSTTLSSAQKQTLPTTVSPLEAQKSSTKSQSYMSFLPSFSDVVVAPARNIMNKALGFNRAVQELISTLAPGGKTAATSTTPRPSNILPAEHQQRLNQQLQAGRQPSGAPPPLRKLPPNQFNGFQLQQQLGHHEQGAAESGGSQANRTQGPLLLTESEARALSAQLDQLSKEQLEALSSDLFEGEQRPQQPRQAQQARQQQQVHSPAAGNQNDYVVRLLKMLVRSSPHPEDIRLLDQLAHQLSNPRPNGQDQSLIEIGQPDDLALLEALGMIAPGSQAARPSGEPAGPQQQRQADSLSAASYASPQHNANLVDLSAGRHEHARPGDDAKRERPQRVHAFKTLDGMPPLEIATDDGATTRLIPVALSALPEVTSPAPRYERPATTVGIAPHPPAQVVGQYVQEQPVVPPVKQTYTELIENNVTTQDGIETTLETRTKSSVSAGAGFHIGAQVGLGLVPGQAFGGALPAGNSSRVAAQDVERGKDLSSSPAPSAAGSVATLNSYDFASQPVDQFEEVVVKKKFQPFAKTFQVVTAPQQQTSFTVEEARDSSSSAPEMVFSQQQFSSNEQQQQTNVELGTTSASFPSSWMANSEAVGGNASAAASSESPLSSSAQQGGNEQEQQVKEDDFRTVASTFGEAATNQLPQEAAQPTTSKTQQDIQRQQRIAQDLSSIEAQLRQRERQQELSSAGPVVSTTSEPADASLAAAEEDRMGARRRSTTHKPKSTKKARKSRGQKATSTTVAPSGAVTAKRSVEDSATTTSTREPRQSGASRLEEAFSNYMVELKRSRKSGTSERRSETSTTSTSTTTTTTTTSTTSSTTTPRPGEADELASASEFVHSPRRKSRSKKQRNNRVADGDIEAAATDGSKRRSSSKRRQQQRPGRPTTTPTERVAIYGTKSGFMPILAPDDPSLALAPAEPFRSAPTNRLDDLEEPMSSSASFTSSKRQPAAAQMVDSAQRKQQVAKHRTQNSWRDYFGHGKLSEQISVVHLGNYTEEPLPRAEPSPTKRVIQVKLVILPSSPDDQLLSAGNWQHLAANYPALFPRDLEQLRVETVDLGGSSIDQTNGNLIDERQEAARHAEFRARYERIADLIETRTFKALDEIVQRSSGRLFAVQRRDTRDRTIIAVIPDRPLIRSALAPAGGYQRLVAPTATLRPTASPTPAGQAEDRNSSNNMISSQASPTQAAAPSPPARLETTPQKAATFSRAIQESIQEAIRQHYDTVKGQLRRSMMSSATSAAPVPAAEPTSDDDYNRQRKWITPAADALANIEPVAAGAPSQSRGQPADGNSTGGQPDPMEAAGSSTEYSIAVAPPGGPASGGREYKSQPLLEVEGAEPKSLYGLELLPGQQMGDQERLGAPGQTTTSERPPGGEETPASGAQPKMRFISIGSHLMAAPMSKIVDQAYVNHFYDHISDHQLTKSIGLDELASNNQTDTSDAAAESQRQLPVSGEAALVPESACTRAGLFQHPFACNKFYECFWDKQLAKFTLHMFECPIKLAFDERIVGCAMPIESSLCVNM